MSNNSFVTPDGKEIGRAQAVQAAACRLPPRADFNPILIKPESQTTAQLVVGGEVAGSLCAKDFGLVRREYWRAAQEAFQRLSQAFDVVVLEGAGSPAEVNLRHCDVVNMQMPALPRAVLLVGDIERGGVFASLVGTWALLDESDRRHLKAFAINKFGARRPCFTMESNVCPSKRIALRRVLPHWGDLDVPEEDALGWDGWQRRTPERADCVVIRIADVPGISNFTDFEPLTGEPDVEVVRLSEVIDRPLDAVIFPGSKQTIQALRFVRERGLDRLAHRVLAAGGTVGGICGGYQLLGRVLRDPERLESSHEEVDGLGMLPAGDDLCRSQDCEQASGRHAESGCTVVGYQVRMGRTAVPSEASHSLS
jgi:cobyric acid synthase CobQ